jgi:hypothetical protein
VVERSSVVGGLNLVPVAAEIGPMLQTPHRIQEQPQILRLRLRMTTVFETHDVEVVATIVRAVILRSAATKDLRLLLGCL